MGRVIRRKKLFAEPEVQDSVAVRLPHKWLTWGTTNTQKTVFVLDPVIGKDGEDEAPATTSPITGRQLKYFAQFLKAAGIVRDDFCIIAACPPVTADQWRRDKAMTEHLKSCREHFNEVIDALDPKMIVPMGKHAASQLAARSVAITKVRGLPVMSELRPDVIVLPTLGINHVLRIPDNESILRSDIETIKSIIDSKYNIKYSTPIERKYEWITDLKPLLDNPPEEIAVDCEWTGGEWFEETALLLTVQISTKAGQSYAIPINYAHTQTLPAGESYSDLKYDRPLLRKRLRKQLKRLLGNPNVKVFGQNFKGDALMLKAQLGIDVANYFDDTMLLAHMHDENTISKSLSDLTRIHVREMSGYSDVFDRDPIHQGKTRMDLVPPDKMLEYGCGDTDATFRLKSVLESELKKDRANYNCYRRVVMPAMNAFVVIEQEGFYVDPDALEIFEKQLRIHQKKEYKRLLAMVPQAIKDEYINEKTPSITRPSFLIAMLFQHKKGLKLKPKVFTKSTRSEKDKAKQVPSVSTKDHLPFFKGKHDFVDGIIDYIKNEKMLGTYVGSRRENSGFYKYIFNGRVRPSYMLHKAVTGRTASRNPNGQNFPKRGMFAKAYRKIFRAPKGWKLIEVDFSQIELRIAALCAKEPTMLALYAKGADIHSATAAETMGITLEEFMELPEDERKLKRFQAKAINFGFLYGMGWRKFINYAKTEYGIEFTEEEAQQVRNAFFRLYGRLRQWHDSVRQYVKEKKYVRAFDGRVRHLPSVDSPDEMISSGAERQAINSPVQGMGSDLGLMAMALITQNVSKKDVRVLGFVHDALICLVPEDSAMNSIRIVKQYMENLPLKEWFNWEPTIPLPAEASIGDNLAELEELPEDIIKNPAITSYASIQLALKKREIRKEFKKTGKRIPIPISLLRAAND